MKEIPFREGIFGISSVSLKPYLLGSQCTKCRIHFFPPKRMCPVCFDTDIKEVPLNNRGRVYSYTVARQGPPGFFTPYAVVYVDLPEGLRVFAQSDLSCWEGRVPVIGKEVELTVGPIYKDEEGNEVVGIKFNPV